MPNDNIAQIKEKELLTFIDKNRALDATYKLIEIVLQAKNFDQLTQNIADIIPKAMGYELGILFLVDYPKQTLVRTAVSKIPDNTDDFQIINDYIFQEKCDIPLGYDNNLCIKSLNESIQYIGPYLYDFTKPSLTQNQATFIQEVFQIKSCISTPLISHDESIGVLLIATKKSIENLTNYEKEMLIKFSENAGIAVENSKLLRNLKKAKDNLSKAYENLKVLNKMKDEFLTIASHELRTPMTIIKSYLWMLEQEKAGGLNKKQKNYLKKATTGTQRMINLINDMLDISKFEQNKIKFNIKQVEICSVIKDIINSFEPKVKEKGIYLTLEPDCKDVFVDVDEEKIREVIINLVDNATNFTDKGGIEIGIDNKQTYYRVWVKDTGKGIDPMNLKKLFHKFGRLNKSYTVATEAGGTGLGLYIVKLYVEGMGGKVGAWSEGEEKGSIFWIDLPKAEITKYKGPKKKIKTLKETQVPSEKINSIN